MFRRQDFGQNAGLNPSRDADKRPTNKQKPFVAGFSINCDGLAVVDFEPLGNFRRCCRLPGISIESSKPSTEFIPCEQNTAGVLIQNRGQCFNGRILNNTTVSNWPNWLFGFIAFLFLFPSPQLAFVRFQIRVILSIRSRKQFRVPLLSFLHWCHCQPKRGTLLCSTFTDKQRPDDSRSKPVLFDANLSGCADRRRTDRQGNQRRKRRIAANRVGHLVTESGQWFRQVTNWKRSKVVCAVDECPPIPCV